MVITGAGPGIMEAGIEGAGAANCFGVSIRLPFEAATTQFLADDPKLVNFRYFFTRKVTFVKEAHAFVLLPGGFGTLDEALRAADARADRQVGARADRAARRSRRHVLADAGLQFVERELQRPAATSRPTTSSSFCITDDVHVALDEVTSFYRNYHSLRFVDGDLVLRMQHAAVGRRARGAQPRLRRHRRERPRSSPPTASKAEIADGDVPDLARLRLRFDRHSYARLHVLIKRLNDPADGSFGRLDVTGTARALRADGSFASSGKRIGRRAIRSRHDPRRIMVKRHSFAALALDGRAGRRSRGAGVGARESRWQPSTRIAITSRHHGEHGHDGELGRQSRSSPTI